MLYGLYREIWYDDEGYRREAIISLAFIGLAVLIVSGMISLFGWGIYRDNFQQAAATQPQVITASALIKTTVANVKQQGKLVVTTMDVQTYNTSKKSGLMYTGEITTISQGKVLFTMNLHDFDENWISYQDNRILVVIPRNFLKAEIIETQSSEVENNGWLTPDDVVEELRTNNINVNKTNMLSQVNGMLDMVRPNATKELENLFVIPLKATGQNVTVKVTFG